MGREIRRVPANWEHPKRKCPHEPWRGGCSEAKANGGLCSQPLNDDDFDTALTEWLAGYELWKKGEHEAQKDYPHWLEDKYWEYAGAPPDPEYYRPKWETAEWYQVYETVSEGTPVTPPFATKEELIEYLVEHGDFWDQNRGDGGWNRKAAEHFVNAGYAPSLVSVVSKDGVQIKAPRDGDLFE
jgi:hypothetical protein